MHPINLNYVHTSGKLETLHSPYDKQLVSEIMTQVLLTDFIKILSWFVHLIYLRNQFIKKQGCACVGKMEKFAIYVLFPYYKLPVRNNWMKMTKRHPTPNDDRSRALNPTSRDYKAAQDNRSKQLNPKDPVYAYSRGEKKKE